MDAIISVDERHRIVLFNPKAERMFGLPVADALGQPLRCCYRKRPARNMRNISVPSPGPG